MNQPTNQSTGKPNTSHSRTLFPRRNTHSILLIASADVQTTFEVFQRSGTKQYLFRPIKRDGTQTQRPNNPVSEISGGNRP
mmetsp:Transcript_22679/g.50655  ORF Transcript_22679/g.50655 Transcript_22679/m.50655 type:complete len:81 (-) Transcript_22679:51-293(-)